VSRPRSGPEDRSLIERAVHDLLNPVSAVLGLGETLRSRGASLGDEAIRSFGESITRQASRLEDAIRDLSRAARLMRGGPDVAAQDVSAREVLQPFAADRVTVEVEPGTRLHADPVLIAEAVRRLVSNALAFSTGPVRISAGGGGEGSWIEVADHGTGFAEGALDTAFEPLTPGTNTRNERGTGLGLGLYIARGLVEAHGGTLTATSVPGEGSVFRIQLRG